MRLIQVLSILAFAAFATPAHAEEPARAPAEKVEDGVSQRAPLQRIEARRTHLGLDQYHNAITIVRKRSPGKLYASFHADPKLLDEGAVVIFQVRSVADTGVVQRWRCLAFDDVAECLGAPIRFRYLPADTEIVLTAKLVPEHEARAAMRVASR